MSSLPAANPLQMDSLVGSIKDQNLKFTLSFGVGLHHAGLHEHDRRAVEQLFVNQKIQVGTKFVSMVASSQLFSYLGSDSDEYPGLGRQLPRPPSDRQGDGVF